MEKHKHEWFVLVCEGCQGHGHMSLQWKTMRYKAVVDLGRGGGHKA